MSELLEEIKQTKPFSSLEEEVYLNLQRTAYIMSVRNDAVIEAENITRIQYNVLRILRGAGEGGLDSTEISDRLVTKHPDIAKLIDQLEIMQLINRQRNAMNRDEVKVKITLSGLELLERLDQPIRESNKRNFGHLGKKVLTQLNELLVLARSKTE